MPTNMHLSQTTHLLYLQFGLFVVLLSYAGSLPLYQRDWNKYDNFNPEENLGTDLFLTEGDILIDREKARYLYIQEPPEGRRPKTEGTKSRQRRSIDSQYYKTWYNRSVPYIYDFTFSAQAQEQVENAIFDIQNSTCLRFKRRQQEKDYIRFIRPESGSCYSPVGRTGGSQEVALGDACLNHGTIQHEILHALGLWHEQSRSDRDDFIQVMWDNIQEEHRTNFQRRNLSESHEVFLRLPYDYGSVMHYANNTFAKDRRKPTIVPKQDLPVGVVMGQRVGLSRGDMDKINVLYRCDITNCSSPGNLTNGRIDGADYSVGSKLYYYCNSGYVLIGAPERVCLDIGEWSGQHPVCLQSNGGRTLKYCSFDNQTAPFCGWTQGSDDDLDWTLLAGPTMSEGTGPNVDHTLSTVYGVYAYVEASNRSPRQKARLVSPVINMGFSTTCLVFYTSMHGELMGNLTVYKVNPGSRNPTENNALITIVGDQGEQWKQVFLAMEGSNAPFTIIFEGVLGYGYTSDIAVDDIVIGDCNTFKPLAISGGLAETVQCTFDAGLCQFLQDRRDDMDWTFNVGQTATFLTGPDCDPLDCQNGRYLYIESSRPRMMGNRARLNTPVIGFKGEVKRCLSFYYHMFGEHIGTLTVKLTNVLSATELVLWAASGDQGNRWHIKELEYNAQEAYQISFDGTVGPSYRGDIAIDNIAITEGGCLSSLQVNCSFTHSLCGWVNAPAPGDILDWTRHRGETETPDTGPLSDRLGPNGYYVYVESSRTTLGDMARLVSPTIRSSLTGYCFTFWYHMYGRTVGNLTVSSQSSNGRETVLWSKLGDQGNTWHSGYINITSNITSSQSFKIVFEATMVGFSGDVAIDDVSLQESLCNQR